MFKWLKFWDTQNSTTKSGTIEDLKRYGPRTSDVNVTPASAMQQATVFSCVRVLSDTVAQMPCRLTTENRETGQSKLDTGNPLYRVLRWKPCPWLTAFDYWRFNVTCMNLYGYHLSYIIRGATGKVRELLPINPANVTKITKNDRTGKIWFHLRLSFQQGGTEKGTKEIKLEGGTSVYYTYYGTIDGITPISPIGQNAAAIGLAITATKHGAAVFNNDATPPLVVEMPQELNPEQAKRFVETWKATGSGAQYGLPRILESGAKVQRLSMSNEDAQYLETRQFQTDEIAGIFGVPPHMVGSQQQAKGWSTMEQLMTEFITLNINPWTTRFEQSIQTQLVRKENWGTTTAKFETKQLLRGDTAARGNFYKDLFGMGSINPNEIRRLEDMNAREDENGTQYYVTANVKTPEQLEMDGMTTETNTENTDGE